MNSLKNFFKITLKFFGFLLILFIVFWIFYFLFIRAWHLNWGSSPEEIKRSWIGDSLVPTPQESITRALTVKATAAKIWPWIIQTGQSRGGFYSYDWLENLFGLDIHNVYEIKPDLQKFKSGDTVKFAKQGGLPATIVDSNKAFIIHAVLSDSSEMIKKYMVLNWGFLLDEKGDGTTRLIARWRLDMHSNISQMLGNSIFILFMIEPAHFIMERKMLQTIKNLSEHNSPYNDSFFENETVYSISLITGLLGIFLIYLFGKNWWLKVVLGSSGFIFFNISFWFYYPLILTGIILDIIIIGLLILLLNQNLKTKKIAEK